MREAAFIRQNTDKWQRFESVLHGNNVVTADELSSIFIEVSDDLSFAQTYYPHSQVVQYLNSVATLGHQRIYRNKKESRNRFITFFTKEMPLEMYKHQRQLLISFLVFALFTIVGAWSQATDGAFARSIVGDGYVNMTQRNIEDGDPMRVYKESGEMTMFLGITVNNIRVAFYAFLFGIFLGLGTLVVLMRNAVMLGCFQMFFFQYDLGWESMRTIWIHGTIEISIIIVAGAAGLVVAKGILFPGTYTRLYSFVQGFKSGLKVLISTVPFFIIAGFLEGFVTRQTEMPDALAILIIGGSLAWILWYYVFLPQILHRKQQNELLQVQQ